MVIEYALTVLQREIVRTIAYFDVFLYPLTKEQICTFISCEGVTLRETEEALSELSFHGFIHSDRGFYFFADRTTDLIEERIRSERRAAKMLKRAKWMSVFLKQLPFIRAIFITGSLSKYVASSSSDIDFMIVTAPDRLWICKMILTGFRRVVLLNAKKYFCLNLMVTENGTFFPLQNYFTAIEIATTQVIWNERVLRNYQSENAWIRRYLPNWRPQRNGTPILRETPSPIQRALERVMDRFPLDSMNMDIMAAMRRFWRNKRMDLDDAKFDSIIQCTPDVSSVWHDDHQTDIMSGYRRRLIEYGIEETL